MKINNIQSNYKSNTDFKGIFPKNKLTRWECHYVSEVLSKRLNQDSGYVFRMIEDQKINKVYFLHKLTDLLSNSKSNNVFKNNQERKLVKNIYQSIENPTKIHINILKNYKLTIEQLSKIFYLAKDKKSLNYVSKFASQIMNKDKEFNQAFILEILNSKHSDEYIKNFNKYKNFFILSKGNPEYLKALDSMVENKTFNPRAYKNAVRNSKTFTLKDLNKNSTKIHTLQEQKESPIISIGRFVQNKYLKYKTQLNSLFVIKPSIAITENITPDTNPKSGIFKVIEANIVSQIESNREISKQKLAKIKTKEHVIDYVSKKLGKNTFADQKITYGKYATKMRMEFLPEIFKSISETRASDRKKGITKSLSSNKDALELFRRINGSNKKLVNYLLKKRNPDNTRMFEVKEIIDIIENTTKEIKFYKSIDSRFKAKQAKELFDKVLNSKIQTLGKVNYTKTKDMNIKPKTQKKSDSKPNKLKNY